MDKKHRRFDASQRKKLTDKAVFLDRDGTIIEEKGYLSDPDNITFIPDVIPALQLLQRAGFKLILATNQSGVARKFFSKEVLEKIHRRISDLLVLNRIRLSGVYYCPHHPDEKCRCRKPEIGMALEAKRRFNLNLSKCFCIGDKISDINFAKNFHGKSVLVLTGLGRKELPVMRRANIKPDFIASDILAAARWVVKNSLVILFWLIASAGISFAQISTSTPPIQEGIEDARQGVSEESKFVWRKVENKAFKVGEKLRFDISWSIFTAGYATMEVRGLTEYNNRKVYRCVTTANSYKFFDVFYKVRNRDESWIDAESICSLKYEKHQHEGKYIKDEYAEFDHLNKKFNIVSKVKGKPDDKKQGDIPVFVQDIISALYYVRTLKLEVGKEYTFDTQTGDKNYPLKMKVLRKEKVKVPAGKFKCYVVEPMVAKDTGLFKAKGRIWIWLTRDERRIPVLMKSKIFIGYITAKLTKLNR